MSPEVGDNREILAYFFEPFNTVFVLTRLVFCLSALLSQRYTEKTLNSQLSTLNFFIIFALDGTIYL